MKSRGYYLVGSLTPGQLPSTESRCLHFSIAVLLRSLRSSPDKVLLDVRSIIRLISTISLTGPYALDYHGS
jgi:hypothetical protein